jgi:hypothetical protein
MDTPIRRKPPAAGIGRKKGVPNKLTKAAKELFELVHQDIGGRAAMAEWARRHRTQFYTLFARLIPVDSRVSVEHTTRLSYAEERALDAASGTPGLAPSDPIQRH